MLYKDTQPNSPLIITLRRKKGKKKSPVKGLFLMECAILKQLR